MQYCKLESDCDVNVKYTHQGYVMEARYGSPMVEPMLELVILRLYRMTKKGIKVPQRVFDKLNALFREILEEPYRGS